MDMNMECPHCGTFVSMDDTTAYPIIRDEQGDHKIFKCKKCGQNVYMIFGETSRGGKSSIFQYPWSIPKLHSSIPQEVAEDYIEAMKCMGGGSSKGALTMFRRSIQVAARKLGAKQSDLLPEIDELEKNGIITKDIKELAHQIRLLGNDGAHPNRPDVSMNDAKEIKEFVDNFFNYIYIMPYKIAEMKSKKLKP